MSTALARRLPDLAAEITREHELCEGSYRTALAHALKIGELLIDAKAQLSHGEWLPWVGEHTPLSARSAQAYMQLAAEPNAQATAHLTIEAALHAIAQSAGKPARTDLRTALGGVDHADALAALAELGEMRHEPHPFPASAMERTTWRQIDEALGRVTRARDEACADGLSKWSRREALHEAARHARNVGSQLTELADSLAI
jgi:Protein of unknown function (DUF3102)